MKYTIASIALLFLIGNTLSTTACTNAATAPYANCPASGCDADGVTCLNCNSGYYASGATGCMSCQNDRCDVCTAPASVGAAPACTACINGFFLDTTGNCIAADGCDYLDGWTAGTSDDASTVTGAVCASCMVGYALEGDACLACATGAGSVANCAACDPPASGARAADNAVVCTAANAGYFLNAAGAPTECPGNCAMCTDASTCTACDATYYLIPTSATELPDGYVAGGCASQSDVIDLVKQAFKSVASVVAIASLVAFFKF